MSDLATHRGLNIVTGKQRRRHLRGQLSGAWETKRAASQTASFTAQIETFDVFLPHDTHKTERNVFNNDFQSSRRSLLLGWTLLADCGAERLCVLQID